ncbi:MAG: vitamin K epoxide reductase family protein [Anaerolineaceae bacterium]|nr:vitamin K epoxide reductase family protein [Anaerolineaceae bacterium]
MLSDTQLRRFGVAFSILGLFVALYLVYIKINPASTFCAGVGDCEAVNTSVYSEINGVPIAVLGALAYAFILGVLLLESKLNIIEQWGPLAIFGTALIGVLYSAYLTYIELAVIHKICPYCVASAVVMTIIFVFSIIRLRKYL